MEHQISASVMVNGSIIGCKTELLLGYQDKQLMFYGMVHWGDKKPEEALELVGYKEPVFENIAKTLLPDNLPGELSVSYKGDYFEIGVQDKKVLFKAARYGESSAVLFAFAADKKSQDSSLFISLLNKAADFFGIEQFILYAQSGSQWLLPKIRPKNMAEVSIPTRISTYRFMTYAHFELTGSSIFVQALNTLFGLKETDVFVAAGKNEVVCMLNIPSFKTSFMESRDLYIEMGNAAGITFRVRGSFLFPFVSGMTFHVDCGVTANAFELEAFAHTEEPIPLFGPFSIGDTCLMIKVSTGLGFGMYTSLYIRKIQLFAALILQVQGSIVTPQLISAAVSDLSIPILLENLLGKKLEGIEVLDFIKIMGLPFQSMDAFQKTELEQKNVSVIVEQFNRQVKSDALRLEETQVQLTQFGNGMDLADLKRMRHYYINDAGKLQLAAQFYYASTKTTLGNYQIEPGIFFCGAIEIFKKRFEVLFCYKENEGILAYAKIPSMDLGFLKVGPSQVVPESEKQFPLPKDSVLAQFLNTEEKGIVFFLSAVGKDISFYLDGRVELLGLFMIDARIIFSSGLVSVDLRMLWLGILQISLHIKVSYGSFSDGGFALTLMIDTSKLAEKLTAVTKKIDEAITRLRGKIDNAKKEIDRAQGHVNELYGQIDSFNRRIEQCKQDIRNASWWKKVFVAIAKGAEIGAYEVAKVGIYAAIGVATAALQVAKGIVSISGKIGEGVLKAVNGIIKGAMSLFFINYIKLDTKADMKEQYFQAEIEFVALGKTYKFNKQIGTKKLEASPTGELSDHIGGAMQNDLDHIEDGAFKANWRKYKHESYTIEQQCRRMDDAREYLKSSVTLMQGIQNSYVNEFETPMSEFDGMNVSLMKAFDDAQNILAVGAQAGDVTLLAQSMGGLKRSVRAKEKKGVYRDEDLKEVKQLITDYDEARHLYDKVTAGMNDVARYHTRMEQHCERLQRNSSTKAGNVAVKKDTGDLVKVMGELEEQLYEQFPVNRSGQTFINLSREPVIWQCLEEADKEIGRVPDDKIMRMRSRSRKGRYESRL